MERSNSDIDNSVPLVVDLDGTLIKGDVLFMELKMLLHKNLFYLFPCLVWLIKGKVNLKQKIHNLVQIQAENLPYNDDLLDFLKTEAAGGRRIVLATATLRSIAVQISKVQPVFDEVYGTENGTNLKGKNKLKLLIEKFGEQHFDYIGNSYSDLTIFSGARYSYLVNPKKSLIKKTMQVSELQFVWN